MRCVTAILSVAVVVLMTTGLVAQAKPNFAGDWMMVGPDGRGDPGATLTITQSTTAMTVENKGCDPGPKPAPVRPSLPGERPSCDPR